MSEKTDLVLSAVDSMVRNIHDPEELQRKLRTLINDAYPVPPKPIFLAGETMPMHEFIARYKKKICGGVEPRFCGTIVHIIGQGPHGLSIEVETTGGEGGAKGA